MKSPVAIGCFGCLGLFAVVILVGAGVNHFMTPAQRAALHGDAAMSATASEVADDAKIGAFFRAMSDLRARLPTGDALTEQASAPVTASELPYSTVDAGWLALFSDGRFTPGAASSPPLYRDQDFGNIAAEAVPAPGMPSRDTSGLVGNIDDLAHAAYVVVIVPQEERRPVLNSDGQTFEPGVFRGWVILLDWRTKRPIGRSAVSATSSPDIHSFQIGVHSRMLIGDDLRTAMESDFTNHFWQAVNAAVARAAGQPGKQDFASHQPYYRASSS
ncbi:hypothetical protein [Sphingomonas sp.]|uniref:hypothetical protein n=1 Tax=Sphingomonas sp. TaxID=28214 RepID=UPI003CC553D2